MSFLMNLIDFLVLVTKVQSTPAELEVKMAPEAPKIEETSPVSEEIVAPSGIETVIPVEEKAAAPVVEETAAETTPALAEETALVEEQVVPVTAAEEAVTDEKTEDSGVAEEVVAEEAEAKTETVAEVVDAPAAAAVAEDEKVEVKTEAVEETEAPNVEPVAAAEVPVEKAEEFGKRDFEVKRKYEYVPNPNDETKTGGKMQLREDDCDKAKKAEQTEVESISMKVAQIHIVVATSLMIVTSAAGITFSGGFESDSYSPNKENIISCICCFQCHCLHILNCCHIHLLPHGSSK
ncbi:hypothetical protein FXO38_14345 [Capsicum annuum]|nr:hypothetical protein FXO38_14345 [Capsicum annuum]KAF3674833.1 hypothetical protein FXO37_06183 [Capsicum annuum]